VIDVAVIVGTRPQIIKAAPVIRKLSKEPAANVEVIHTGQHYDYELSRIFFRELSLPQPVANLGIGSSETHAVQTGRIMIALEGILAKLSPDVVLIPGDTNSALAASLVAAKSKISSAHLEAGPRNFDLSIPEEVNRIVSDHLCGIDLAPTPSAVRNLRREGLSDRIVSSGDTMLDSLLAHLDAARKIDVLDLVDEERDFIMVTIHRQENADSRERLRAIIRAVTSLTKRRFVFPVHPRTKKRLKTFHLWKRLSNAKHVRLIPPVGYETNIALVLNARVVMTDSGGLQKEAFWLGVPCVTVFDNTAWPETLLHGANRCTAPAPRSIQDAISKASSVRFSSESSFRLFGGGEAASRVCKVLLRMANSRSSQRNG
jgi:UDP-N-acetylglucosamine 2-epimerase (non-hydrolysing)